MSERAYEPDYELRALIRSVAATLPPHLNLKPQFSATAVNLSKINPVNIRSQTCIQSLSQQVAENNLDLRKVKDICTILDFFWENLTYNFDAPPESLPAREKNKFESFKTILNNSARRCRQNKDIFLYSPRAEIGDQTAVDELLIALLHLLEGLERPAAALYPREGNGMIPNLSKLEDVVWKCQKLSFEALKQLNKRLLKTADAEDLMLKCINAFKCTADVVENHPLYKDPNPLRVRPRVGQVPREETHCERQVTALNGAAARLKENLTEFGCEDARTVWKVESYARGAGSDDAAVKGLKDELYEVFEKLYWPYRGSIENGHVLDVDQVISCASAIAYDIGSLQVQLFQRLRPRNEPCYSTRLLKPTTNIEQVGAWKIKRDFTFTCRSCESDITWLGVTERRSAVDPQWPWKCIGEKCNYPVHEHYAVGHHLPAVKRKGGAKLYCGYCCTREIGTPIDPRFVFDGIGGLYQHLHAMHDVEEEPSKCCVIL